MVFSIFGDLEYLEKLSPGMEFHSKVRFKTEDSALQALNSLNGRNIYDGCCHLELTNEVPPEESKKIECSTQSQIGVDNTTHLAADVDRLTLGESPMDDLITSKMKADLCEFEPYVEDTTLKIVQDPVVQVEKESLPIDDHAFNSLEDTKLQSTLMEECTIGINHSYLVDNLVRNNIPSTDSSQTQLQLNQWDLVGVLIIGGQLSFLPFMMHTSLVGTIEASIVDERWQWDPGKEEFRMVLLTNCCIQVGTFYTRLLDAYCARIQLTRLHQMNGFCVWDLNYMALLSYSTIGIN